MKTLVIARAARTPIGRMLGGLTPLGAAELGVIAGKAALDGIDPASVDRVILGNVLSAGLGQNVARQVAVTLGCPVTSPAFTVNLMCGSGMQSIALGGQSILTDESRAVLVGGVESMSNSPYILEKARAGYRLGDGALVDTITRDGLSDAFDRSHMGMGAEALAERYGISREAQDRFAYQSQQRYGVALAQGRFTRVVTPAGKLTQDEHPRPDTTLEKLGTLRPAFKPDGTVTAGNASGVNDGAGLLLLTTCDHAEANGWVPLCRVTGWEVTGCEPRYFGIGPVEAVRRLCARIGTTPAALDALEINEAFAAQALACVKELGIDPSSESFNPDGGAIAVGHPIGASGARIACHMAHQVASGRFRRAVGALCIGGGMGIAMAFESL